MSNDTHPSGAPWRNFYGRFRGKTLRPSQETYLDEDLAALSPGAVGWEENPDRVPLDLERLFGGRPLWLEIQQESLITARTITCIERNVTFVLLPSPHV